MDFESQSIKLPKLGAVRFFKDRKFDGGIRQATVSASSTDRYYVSLLVETGAAAPVLSTPSRDTTVGIDLGIKDFATTSDGKIFENPRHFVSSQKRLGIYQKRLSFLGPNGRLEQPEFLAINCPAAPIAGWDDCRAREVA